MDAPLTQLVISGVDLPRWSGLALSENLGVISQAGNNKRTINGALVDLSDPNFRKRKWRISSSDALDFPDFKSLWPGALVTVTTVTRFAGASLTFTGRVMDFETTFDEWTMTFNWSLDVEEV